MSYKEINFDWLEEIIVPSIDSFYRSSKDRDLLERDINERTIVANIYCKATSIFIEKQNTTIGLENLGIDIEYNRNYSDSKRVNKKCGLCKNEGCFIKERNLQHAVSSPDMIFHQRGSNENNLVLIEFKKVSNPDSDGRDTDTAKLIYFTCQQPYPDHENENYQFHIGFFIELDIDRYSVTSYQDATDVVSQRRQGGVWL